MSMVNERHNVKTSDQNEFFRIKTLIDRDPHLLRVTNTYKEGIREFHSFVQFIFLRGSEILLLSISFITCFQLL